MALAAKSGSRMNSQDRYCQGLIVSAARVRRTAEAGIAGAMPRPVTSTARSGQLHGPDHLAGGMTAGSTFRARSV